MPPYTEYKFQITHSITASVWAYSLIEATNKLADVLESNQYFEIANN
jgi:hypothetical protein